MLNRLLGLFRHDLAIDLGTANTLISVPGEGLVLDEPSVVAVERGTRRVLSGGCAVGHLARQLLGRTPDTISVVRPLREGVIADFRLCEAMLRYFIRKARPGGFRLGPRVLIAVPACSTSVERRAVYTSATRAGAREVLLVSDATAAAIGAGLPVAEPVASMICDIGGGTTEIAVLSLCSVVAGSSIRLGGDQMDEALAAWLKEQRSLKISTAAAERLRIEIGAASALEEQLSAEACGTDPRTGLPRRVIVTSADVREALSEPLRRIADALRSTLDGLSPDLIADLMDNGLLLVGGGALLRGLDQFITAETGLPARVWPEALSAVARGSQICLEQLPRWRASLESSDDDL